MTKKDRTGKVKAGAAATVTKVGTAAKASAKATGATAAKAAKTAKTAKTGRTVGSLGDYLREQRTASRLSLRQLSDLAGVSNPYLSQIERGLRKPSAEVLQQIAKALRISAEQLYVRAGILSPDDGVGGSVELAVLGDTGLTERQKQSLLDVYASFLALNAAEAGPTTGAVDGTDPITTEG